MSLVWQHCAQGNDYQVRAAGNSIRLYTNGVFHSQWNPQTVLSGALWDLLSLPAAALPHPRVARVLVLGVGGGAVIRQLCALYSPATVTGVELDPVHLQIARRHFGLSGCQNVVLVQADAVGWLASCTLRFDLIIDDVFGHACDTVQRSVSYDAGWCKLLCSRLQPGGLLVSNFDDLQAARLAALPLHRVGLRHGYTWSLPAYHNRVAIHSQFALDTLAWRQTVQQCRCARASTRRRLLNTRWRSLEPIRAG